ncbi:MAG: DMT family transporter [Planctomycetota bacterium]
MNRREPARTQRAAQPRLALFAAAVLFSTGGAAIKALAFTGWQVASFRSGVAALATALLLPAARRRWPPRTWLAGTAYAATMVLFVVSNKLTTSANAIFLQSTAPLYILFLGPWLLREPVRRDELWYVLIVIAGLALFFIGHERPASTAPRPMLGNVAALCSGVCWALTIVSLRWLGAARHGDDSAPATIVTGNLLAFLGCLPLALPVASCRAQDILVVAFLGVFQIAVAYALVTFGLRHLRALEASAILLVEPALNPIWSWLMHGEVPSMAGILGGTLILGATVARSWRGARAPP